MLVLVVVITLQLIKPFHYGFEDTIAIDGEFGIAIDVIDQINKQPFNFGIYKISLFLTSIDVEETFFELFAGLLKKFYSL